MSSLTEKKLKILLVAGYFPPHAPVSATRVNKFAKYLLDQGHDIRVLAPKNLAFPQVMAAEIPLDRITFTPVFEVLDVPGRIKDGLKSLLGKSPKSASGSNQIAAQSAPISNSDNSQKTTQQRPGWWTKVMAAYTELVSLPDARIGWYPYAIRAGRLLLGSWKADVIISSAPPHTGCLVASKLGRLFNIPWVAEFRDLWVDHPYYDSGKVKKYIEDQMERSALKSAAGLVTVTQSWADWLQKKHPYQPVELAMNGYDPADYPDVQPEPLDRSVLTIIYAGVIYGGKRDPSVLFAAIKKLGPVAERIKVIFHVVEVDEVRAIAERYDVLAHVEINGLIPRKDVILRQCAADILLLLRWNDPREDSVLAGKLFEYIGARRPILSLGSVTGEAAAIIRDNNFGIVTNDVDEVAAALENWLSQKGSGQVPASNPNVENFARAQQFARLEKFLEKLAVR